MAGVRVWAATDLSFSRAHYRAAEIRLPAHNEAGYNFIVLENAQ
jgi:hypothetical protein